MHPRILATNGGVHPADKWAALTAEEIIKAVFGDKIVSKAVRRFELAILDVLEAGHDRVQNFERAKIVEHGAVRLTHPLGAEDQVAGEVAAIVAAAAKIGTVEVPVLDDKGAVVAGATKTVDLGAHFAKPEIQAAVAGLIGSHYATAIDIERSWFTDAGAAADAHRAKHLNGIKHDPDNEHVRAFKAARNSP